MKITRSDYVKLALVSLVYVFVTYCMILPACHIARD